MFEATYYNGLTSKPFSAQIEIDTEGISIHYISSEGLEIKTFWKFSDIKNNEMNHRTRMVLSFGDFPKEQLEITDPHFYDIYIKTNPNKKDVRSPFTYVLNAGQGLPIKIGIGIAIFAAFSYFVFIPYLSEYAADHWISPSVETTIGNSAFAQLVDSTKINKKKTILANSFLNNLKFPSNYPIQITILESSQINAFALPGGRIVVYDSLLNILETKEEFAALLSHEIIHIERKHSLRSICKNLSSYMFLSMLVGDLNGIAVILIQNAQAIHNLQFTRNLEREADLEGLKMMKSRKLNTSGMIHLFEKLKAVSDSSSSLKFFKYLSTHPLTDERLEYITKATKDDTDFIEDDKLDQIWKNLKDSKN